MKKDNTSPTLSLVMPFFNQKEQVAEMIDSILANDYNDWELLAIDDGSTEETAAYLEHYSQNDNRIKIVRRDQEPKGAQTCRNKGLNMANGEYIIFLDSDDYVAPYCLRNRVLQISTNPDVDFMVFKSGSFSNRTFNANATKDVYGYHIYHDDLKAFIRRSLPFTVWTNIYRTEALREEGLRWDVNIRSYQDSDFNIQAILHGLRYAYADTQPDYGYRIGGNTGSVSKKSKTEEHRKSHLYFIDKLYKEVRSVYGRRYDKALYQCALFIYTETMADAVDASFAFSIANVVEKHDPWRGWLLRMKVKASLMAEKVIPAKIARQLPMPMFLLRRRWLVHAIPHRIAKYLH